MNPSLKLPFGSQIIAEILSWQVGGLINEARATSRQNLQTTLLQGFETVISDINFCNAEATDNPKNHFKGNNTNQAKDPSKAVATEGNATEKKILFRMNENGEDLPETDFNIKDDKCQTLTDHEACCTQKRKKCLVEKLRKEIDILEFGLCDNLGKVSGDSLTAMQANFQLMDYNLRLASSTLRSMDCVLLNTRSKKTVNPSFLKKFTNAYINYLHASMHVSENFIFHSYHLNKTDDPTRTIFKNFDMLAERQSGFDISCRKVKKMRNDVEEYYNIHANVNSFKRDGNTIICKGSGVVKVDKNGPQTFEQHQYEKLEPMEKQDSLIGENLNLFQNASNKFMNEVQRSARYGIINMLDSDFLNTNNNSNDNCPFSACTLHRKNNCIISGFSRHRRALSNKMSDVNYYQISKDMDEEGCTDEDDFFQSSVRKFRSKRLPRKSMCDTSCQTDNKPRNDIKRLLHHISSYKRALIDEQDKNKGIAPIKSTSIYRNPLNSGNIYEKKKKNSSTDLHININVNDPKKKANINVSDSDTEYHSCAECLSNRSSLCGIDSLTLDTEIINKFGCPETYRKKVRRERFVKLEQLKDISPEKACQSSAPKKRTSKNTMVDNKNVKFQYSVKSKDIDTKHSIERTPLQQRRRMRTIQQNGSENKRDGDTSCLPKRDICTKVREIIVPQQITEIYRQVHSLTAAYKSICKKVEALENQKPKEISNIKSAANVKPQSTLSGSRMVRQTYSNSRSITSGHKQRTFSSTVYDNRASLAIRPNRYTKY